MAKEIEFENGGIWEEREWKILFDYEYVYESGKIPCKHCHNEREIVKTSHYDDSTYIRKSCTVPRVVVATNEGGCNSTGVCMDCIVEQRETYLQE